MISNYNIWLVEPEKILNNPLSKKALEAIEWDSAFDAIIDAIDGEDLEETTQTLRQFEHLVVIADTLGEKEKGFRILF